MKSGRLRYQRVGFRCRRVPAIQRGRRPPSGSAALVFDGGSSGWTWKSNHFSLRSLRGVEGMGRWCDGEMMYRKQGTARTKGVALCL